MHILLLFIVLFGKLEFDLVSQKIFDEKLHNLLVFLLLKVVVVESIQASAHHEPALIFALVDCSDGPVARIREWSRCQDGVSWGLDVEGATINVHKINSGSFTLLLILFFLIFSSSKGEPIVVPSFGFFGVAVDDSGDFFVEDTVVDVGFFGMEILIE